MKGLNKKAEYRAAKGDLSFKYVQTQKMEAVTPTQKEMKKWIEGERGRLWGADVGGTFCPFGVEGGWGGGLGAEDCCLGGPKSEDSKKLRPAAKNKGILYH